MGFEPSKPLLVGSDFDRKAITLKNKGRVLFDYLSTAFVEVSCLPKNIVFFDVGMQALPDEAKIIIAIKEQKLSYKGLTYKLVKDTWPDLLPEQEEKSTTSVTEEEQPKTEVENA